VAQLDDPVLAGGSFREELLRSRDWVERVVAQPPETVGSVLMLLVRRGSGSGGSWWLRQQAGELARRRHVVSAEDALLAARTVLRASDDWYAGGLLRAVEGMLRRTIGPLACDEAAADVIRELLDSVARRRHLAPEDRSAVRARLLKLLPAGDHGTVDTSLIAPADGWAARMVPCLATLNEGTAEVTALLRHLATATGSRPAAGWLAASQALLEPSTARAVLRLMLERLTDAEPVAAGTRWGTLPMVLDERNTDLARAAVWATIGVREPWVVPTLHRLAVRAIGSSGLFGGLSGDKLPNACIMSLGQLGDAEAVAALQQLQVGTRHNGFRKRIVAALAQAAVASGLTPGQLVERTVPTGRLREDGTVDLTTGTLTARARVDDDLRVTVAWKAADVWAARPPAGGSVQDMKAVRRRAKELRDVLGAERRRVEELLATSRSWELADWRRYYLDHPVTGRLARRLIWRIVDGGGATVTGLPTATGLLRTLEGHGPLPATGMVTLWHPATSTTDQVSAWRSWLLEQQVRQPFKQAFREVYLLTPAELDTGTYSNRFAAHVLHYRQAYALFKERAWVANFLGPYDGGYEGRAHHNFPDAGLTAVFEHFPADTDAAPDGVELCSTDRVWFFETADPNKAAVPLEQVPPLVFSEAMRDLDLFVGVTSIALDPNWADRGTDPYYDYWRQTSFGPLSATAAVPRDVLARLLPGTKIANRVELGDRHLRVRGNRGTYRVQLQSAPRLGERPGRAGRPLPVHRAGQLRPRQARRVAVRRRRGPQRHPVQGAAAGRRQQDHRPDDPAPARTASLTRPGRFLSSNSRARGPAFSGSIPERAEKHHPAFPRSISLCSYFVATTERFYAEGASREDGYNSVSAPIVDRRGVAPGHDGGDRDAVGHERGRVVEGSSMLLTRRRGVSRHRMIVAASGSVGGTIARRTKATSHGRPGMSACAAQATAHLVASTSPTVLRVSARRVKRL